MKTSRLSQEAAMFLCALCKARLTSAAYQCYASCKACFTMGGGLLQNLVRELRGQYGITQEQLAERVGVSRQTIISIESEKYNPSILLAYKIAKSFNLPIEKVFLCEQELEEEKK